MSFRREFDSRHLQLNYKKYALFTKRVFFNHKEINTQQNVKNILHFVKKTLQKIKFIFILYIKYNYVGKKRTVSKKKVWLMVSNSQNTTMMGLYLNNDFIFIYFSYFMRLERQNKINNNSSLVVDIVDRYCTYNVYYR